MNAWVLWPSLMISRPFTVLLVFVIRDFSNDVVRSSNDGQTMAVFVVVAPVGGGGVKAVRGKAKEKEQEQKKIKKEQSEDNIITEGGNHGGG